jgi:hypothetical protein
MLYKKQLPYYVIVETLGVIIFIIYVTILLKLDKK